MGGETVDPTQLVEALLEAARSEDWETVDEKLVPQLEKLDGDQMASKLLDHVEDEDPNIRDVVATAFSGLKIFNPEIERRVAEAMFKMASEDTERYPAGRAVAYLLTLKAKPEFKSHVSKALVKFKAKAEKKGWTTDLKEAISALTDVLLGGQD